MEDKIEEYKNLKNSRHEMFKKISNVNREMENIENEILSDNKITIDDKYNFLISNIKLTDFEWHSLDKILSEKEIEYMINHLSDRLSLGIQDIYKYLNTEVEEGNITLEFRNGILIKFMKFRIGFLW